MATTRAPKPRRPGPKVMFPGKENKKKMTFSGPPYVRTHIEAASARLEMSMSDTICAFIETYWKQVRAPLVGKRNAYRRLVAEAQAGGDTAIDHKLTPGAKSYYPGKDRARPISFTGPPYIRTHVDKAATREGMTPADLLCHIVETHWKVLKKPDKPKRMPAKRP